MGQRRRQGTPVPHQVRPGRHPARRGRPRAGRDARQPRHRRRGRGFTAEALRALHADITPLPDGFTRRDRRAARRPARRAGPRPRRAAAVPPRPAGPAARRPTWTAPTRTSPRSPATSWSPRSTRCPRPTVRPARRCGVMRTVRGAPGGPRCCWSGSACTWSCPAGTTAARWSPRTPRCSPTGAGPTPPNGSPADEVQVLLAAAADRQRPARSGRSTSPNGPWPTWPPCCRTWTSVADDLAGRLREDHIRVREAGGQRVRRQIAVRAQKPADVLGVYVYLPGRRCAS